MDGMEFFNIEMDQDLAATVVPAAGTPDLAKDVQQKVDGTGLICRADKKLSKGYCSLERDHGFIKVCKGNPCR